MDYEEELESYIATCPGDSVVVEDPNGDLRYEDWYLTQEPGYDKRSIVFDPQESHLHCAPKSKPLFEEEKVKFILVEVRGDERKVVEEMELTVKDYEEIGRPTLYIP